MRSNLLSSALHQQIQKIEVSILEPGTPSGGTNASICRVPVSGEVPPASVEERRKEKLLEVIVLPELPEAEKGKLQIFLEPGERGGTDLVQFEINTAYFHHQRQPAK